LKAFIKLDTVKRELKNCGIKPLEILRMRMLLDIQDQELLPLRHKEHEEKN
jgi:hypothetical protein